MRKEFLPCVNRMRTKAFNEHMLWKGTIQRANYPVLQQPPMDLPKFNTLTGKPHPSNDRIFDEICEKTTAMSREYWLGERLRREAYRAQFTGF
jgi:hypothetical protein